MGKYIHLIELASRLHVFLMLNIYAIGKLIGGQFYRRGQLPPDIAIIPLGEVGPFDLAWTFMGYSYGYILFVGIGQLVGAWLLLWNRTKLLGVLVLLPIMVNIVVFDLFFLDRLGALGSAIFYLSQLLFVLWLNREAVQKILVELTKLRPLSPTQAPLSWLARLLLAGTLVGVFFVIDQVVVNLLGH